MIREEVVQPIIVQHKNRNRDPVHLGITDPITHISKKDKRTLVLHQKSGKDYSIPYFRNSTARDEAFQRIYLRTLPFEKVELKYFNYFSYIPKHIREKASKLSFQDAYLLGIKYMCNNAIQFVEILQNSQFTEVRWSNGLVRNLLQGNIPDTISKEELAVSLCLAIKLPKEYDDIPGNFLWPYLLNKI